MSALRIVIDTNVLVSALRSPTGASYRLVSLIDQGRFDLVVSVPLVFEYEDVFGRVPRLSAAEVTTFVEFLCRNAVYQRVYFRWRTILPDPGDEMVLEVAVAANCDFIVTHNLRHFTVTGQFGIRTVTPREFLREIGAGT